MSKFLNLIFCTALAVLFFVQTAEACRCAGRPQGKQAVQTCGYYWSADSIAVGLAERVTIDRQIGQMKVTFVVEKPIRGVTEFTIEVFTSASSASCGYPFEQGKRYFLYLRKGQDGKYHEHLCGPTTLLENAEDDIEYANEIEAGRSGTRIFGTISEDRQVNVNAKRSFDPLGNIEVTIKSKKKSITTRTDAKGFYIFKDVAPDDYEVKAKFAAGLREMSYQNVYEYSGYRKFDHRVSIRMSPGRCAGENLYVTRQGSIRGKVVGFPVDAIRNPWTPDKAQPRITLFPLDENNQIFPYRAAEEKWAYRDKFEYFFDPVPPGNYLLAMNPNNCPYPNNGIPTVFFPGVSARSDARIVTIKEGEHLVLDDFRSLQPLLQRWFSGTVLFDDKTPAPNATITLLDGDQSRCSNMNLDVKADEHGKFKLQGFETYNYRIRAYTDRFYQKERRDRYSDMIPLGATGDVGNIVLILPDRNKRND